MDSEVWNLAIFSALLPLLSHLCHFLFSALFIELLFYLLSPLSHHLPLPCPQTSSHLLPTLLSFHLISSPLLPLIPLDIYSAEKTPNLPARPSYSVIRSSCSPRLSIPPFSPSRPFCNSYIFFCSPHPPLLFTELLSSRLLKHSRLSSPLPGQGSTIAHFTHDRVCCMPVMYVQYAARGGATDG